RDGQTTDLYFDQNFLTTNYTAAELSDARTNTETVIRDEIITPLQTSLDVLAGDQYMTRLYTTLSADEMTLDPAFVFNPDMGDQPLDRNATLDVNCIDNENHWKLTLGSGTGRDGEVVIDTIGSLPFTTPAITQDASWKIEDTAASGAPVVRTIREFAVATLGSPGTDVSGENTSSNTGGNGSSGLTFLLLIALYPLAIRRHHKITDKHLTH
ncbi:MAG: hypothetical protein AAF404_18250, partial [Pseudomonadota bacterium]